MHNNKKNNNRNIGTAYENVAVLFLEQNGYHVIERNFYTKHGEIDIIAWDGEYLVFIEVKYRKNAYVGAALDAVSIPKQKRIIGAAKVYLYIKGYQDIPCRFDVIAIENERVYLVKNAFGLI